MNGIKPALYVEPFVGGASMALQLMQDGLVNQVIMMDLDHEFLAAEPPGYDGTRDGLLC